MPIAEFTNEVCDRIKYYVYRLVDPRNGETFYVGKGTGNRVFQHALAQIEIDPTEPSPKLNRIRLIIAGGHQVAHVIQRHGLTEDEAFHVEGALIDAFPGLTNLQNGVSNSDLGAMHADDVQRKYAAVEFEPQHRLILLTIRQDFVEERGLYQGCRGIWRMNIERARQAEYVLPILNGIAADVFRPSDWLPATAQNFPIQADGDYLDRIGFVGERAPEEIRNLYVGKRPKAVYLGARIPIRYTYEG